MTIAMRDIDHQIAGLSEQEQARIAADIITRLHGTRTDAIQGWADEALKRYAEVKAGTAPTHDAGDVLAEARSRLRHV